MKSSLDARKLRFVLLGVLLLLIAAGAGAFIYTYSLLKSYTAETSTLDAQARLSDTNVANLKKLKQYLADNELEVQRARDIVAESKQYQYQDDIVRDISSYASQSGVTITSYNFTTAQNGAATSQPTTPSAAASPGSVAPGASAPASGVKTTTASVVIKSPVGYTNLLNFIRRIERSPMKMQIASVSLAKADGSDQNLVTTQSFTIEVYIR